MRTLNRGKVGKSSCLAGIGADMSGFIESARSAAKNIVLDGCKVACGAKIMEKNGLPFSHFIMTDYGVEKGKTDITGQLVETVAKSIENLVTS
jgi:uncharacterized metal-binding protein